jgi:hypothetical protein
MPEIVVTLSLPGRHERRLLEQVRERFGLLVVTFS